MKEKIKFLFDGERLERFNAETGMNEDWFEITAGPEFLNNERALFALAECMMTNLQRMHEQRDSRPEGLNEHVAEQIEKMRDG